MDRRSSTLNGTLVGLAAATLLVSSSPHGVKVAPMASASTTPPAYSWTPTGLPARAGAAMAFDPNAGGVVLFGGIQSTSYLRDTWLWNGTGWVPLAPVHSPPARAYASFAYDPATNNAVLFGGEDDQGEPTNTTWTWDGKDWTKATPTASPAPREKSAMAYDEANGNLVLSGGLSYPYSTDCTSANHGACDDTWTWDGNWTKQSPGGLIPHPSARFGSGIAFDPHLQQVVLFGGTSGSGTTVFADTWSWDGSGWTQLSPPDSPPARGEMQMQYDADSDSIVMFGGRIPTSDTHLDDTWTWNGTDWSTTTPTASPAARSDYALAYDPGHHGLLLLGGCCIDSIGSNGQPIADFMGDWWTWNGDWTKEGESTNPPARLSPSMAYDEALREVVLFGGGDCCLSRQETWEWDGSVWTPLDPIPSPPARQQSAMAYDAATQQIVLFGGVDDDRYGNLLNDTWTWDGAWTQASSAPHPSPRVGAVMAYDPRTQSVVLFGGLAPATCNNYCNDTWSWDGSWTKLDPPDHPPGLAYATMAYDPNANQMVLFGGRCANPTDPTFLACGDTWIWTGSDWTKASPDTSPPARRYSQMAYDPATGNVVLFSGECSDCHGDTWVWDGNNWTQLTLADSPPTRLRGAMAFDSNGSALLFGGYVYDPGVDSGSFSFGRTPTVVRVFGVAGGTVATRAASSTRPLAVKLKAGTTDRGGAVSIALLRRSTAKAPAGLAFLPTEAQIKALRATTSAPLRLTFTLDPSLIAGDPNGTVSVVRTVFGHKPKVLTACTSQNPVSPDPCVSAASVTANGGRTFTVLASSAATTWDFALPGLTRTLTIGYHRFKAAFTGRLDAAAHRCLANQKVTVFRERAGADRRVGSDTTTRRGRYKVHDADARGRFYASAAAKQEPGVGICKPVRSSVVTVRR